MPEATRLRPPTSICLFASRTTLGRPFFSLSDMDALIEERLGVTVDTVPDTCLNPRIEPYIRATLLEV